MKHKASLLRYLMVSVLVVLSMALCFAGCKDDTQRTITWEVPTQATVKVEGYDELPEKVKDGTQLSFTITCTNGYEVDTVKNSGKNVTARDGKYTVSITADTTIAVTVKQQIQSINVTKNPTKLTYLAGESLDKAGMEVEVEYVGGAKQTLQEADYRIVYPTASATAFYRGDASFKVSYQGKESADVALTAPVEAKITINPVGGKIDEGLLTVWEGRTDLHDYEVADNGTITFTYLELTTAFTLPTSAQITLEGGTLLGWVTVVEEGEEATSYTQIGKDNNTSLSLRADWHMVLVETKSVKLEVSDGKPYLVMELTTNTALSAYLYLYEGNAKVGFEGDAIEGKAGSTVTLRYDLTKLSSAKLPNNGEGTNHAGTSELYTSFWMDIRVNTNINGVELSQSIEYDYSTPIAQIGSGIQVGNWSYGLRMDRRNGVDYIRVYFKSYVYTYEVKVEDVDDKPTLTFNGTLNTALDPNFATKYADADVSIAIGSVTATGKVKADGTWTATADLSELTDGFNATASAITVTATDGTQLDVAVENDNGAKTKTSLDLNGCRTIFAYDPDGSEPRYFANKFTSKNGLRYDVGNDWNELYLKVVDPGSVFLIRGDVALKAENNKAYYVVTVQAGANYTEANLKSTVWFGDGSDYINAEKVNSLGSEMYELWFNVTEREANGSKLYVHLKIGATAEEASGWDGGNGDIKDADNSENGKFVIVGEKKYSISNEWNMPNLVVESYDPTAKSITLTGDDVDLVEEGGKPCIVVTVSAENYTEDELKEAVKYGNVDSSSSFSWQTPCIKVVKDGDKYKLYFDLTEMQVGGDNQLWSNLFIPDGDAEKKVEIHDDDFSTNGKTITVNGKKYTIICTGDYGTWRIPCITVEEV